MTMKFEVEAGALATATQAARRMIDPKVKIPILANLLIEARRMRALVPEDPRGQLKITSTDMDTALTIDVAATVIEPGSICAPAGRLADLVAGMDESATVKIELFGKGLAVKTGRSRYVLPVLPAEEFPAGLSAGPDAVEIELDAAAVHDLFVAPGGAISSEATRYYLNGIYLHPIVSTLTMASMLASCATDGTRLILVKTELPAVDLHGIIVPRKAVAEIAKLGKDGVDFRISNKIIEAVAGQRRLGSRLIDGTFPDYARVIPTPSKNTAELDCTDLTSALNRIRAVVDNDEKSSPCGITWGDGGEIELCLANCPDAADDALGALTSGQARVAVSARLLADLLGSFDGAERVRLDVANPASPIMVTVVGKPGLLGIVMPMASQWTTEVAA
jgi:DNA polymerase-3 subunit beta